ncbi:MAG: hypothetical protein WCF41_19620, partial [Pseudolabrys sp.]
SSPIRRDLRSAAGAARVNSDAAGSNSTTRYGRRYAGLRAGRGEAATAASGTAVVSVDVLGSGQSASGGKSEHPVGGYQRGGRHPKVRR